MWCVVETIDNGTPTCTAVPVNWVESEFLSWPKLPDQIRTGRKNCMAVGDDWVKYQCRILYNNLRKFFMYNFLNNFMFSL